MDKEANKQQNSEDIEFAESDSRKKDALFNAGRNDSDYDGGHPEDVVAKDRKLKENQQEQSTSDSFNSGGNDSDYDGGHPGDAKLKKKGK
ncbi:hypothetical protein [Planococcus sp. ISL-110]|uniref:hypothetical protein n=1 Tax=Planococcus sp. ISL-110 TaxID=2819167 RepID=UPI001BEC0D9D|nr:hypothetical protein [Planococcus sp. ISL-110]MBT2569444.1 hypothetical protein [Planococcus sp. ISL-110]